MIFKSSLAIRLVGALLLAGLLAGAPARAEWYEASSDHFVIYADDSEEDVRTFAQRLERYHAAMKFVTGRDVAKPSPSNRVTIFVVGGRSDMRRLVGGNSRIAGFYSPRAGASKAFVQDIRLKDGYPHFSTVILLHEYAHHFLISSSRFAMPMWMREGAAEFFAAASFTEDGGIIVGRPAQHRAGDLSISAGLGMEELLDPFADPDRDRLPSGYYGRAWLLYHYMMFDEGRRAQLDDYWQRVAGGEASIPAAEAAFGDLGELRKALRRYVRSRRMSNFTIGGSNLPIGPIAMRQLPEGEAEAMPVRIRSQRGVDAETAPEVLEDARTLARRYPGDPGVQTLLAEAEYDMGNDAEAIEAADRALAVDPGRVNAYVQKGYALFRRAREVEGSDEDRAAAFEAAMKPFAALNARENDHPLPLIYYYRSYDERGADPSETARAALSRAAMLAPFDRGLWMHVARMHARQGEIAAARASLVPVISDPHAREAAEGARVMAALLGRVEEGTPVQSLSVPGGQPELNLGAVLEKLRNARKAEGGESGGTDDATESDGSTDGPADEDAPEPASEE